MLTIALAPCLDRIPATYRATVERMISASADTLAEWDHWEVVSRTAVSAGDSAALSARTDPAGARAKAERAHWSRALRARAHGE